MKVINLFAGPGAGKSTTAAGLFHLMKLEGMNVELVTEYAKDMTWEKRHNILTDQLYMFAKQHRRIARLKGAVEYVVTDSPLFLSIIYSGDDYPEVFDKLVFEFWQSYDNRNFFIERVKEYVRVGRSQSEDEARKIDAVVKDALGKYEVPFTSIRGDAGAAKKILEAIR